MQFPMSTKSQKRLSLSRATNRLTTFQVLTMQTMSPDADFADDLDQGTKMAGSTLQNETSSSRSNKLNALGIAVACGFLLCVILPTALILGEEKGDLVQQELENSARFLLDNANAFGFDNAAPNNDISDGNTNTFGFVNGGSGSPVLSNAVQGNKNVFGGDGVVSVDSEDNVPNNIAQGDTNGFGSDNTAFSIWDPFVFFSGSKSGVAFDSGLFQGEDGFGSFGSFGAVGPNNDAEGTATDTSPSFLRIEAPFQSKLALFNEGIVGQPYADPALLQEDLENAGKFLLNIVVKRNTNVKGFENVGFGGRNPSSSGQGGGRDVFLVGAPVATASFAGAASDSASQPQAAAAESAKGPTVGDTIDDFGTNNQEQDVEEGDLIVSDGERSKSPSYCQGFPHIVDNRSRCSCTNAYFLSFSLI
jgi:hypothetical protein